MRRSSVIAGIGGYTPDQVITNADLCRRFDTTQEWIVSRTGISTRHRVAPGQSTSDLAVAAAQAALESAVDLGGPAVDLVILATTTPDRPCPATAPLVAARLGLDTIPAFDLSAVCSGFVYALSVADGMIAAGTARRVLVIGADAFTTILNPGDRATATVFGDGAGAMVLRAGEAGEPGALLGFDLGADGNQADLITVAAGGSARPDPREADEADRWFAMRGQAVYRHAVLRMTETARAAMAVAGWQPNEVDRLVAHQANARILTTVGAELEIPPDRVYSNITNVGNTVAASVPLALADAAAAGVLRRGDRVLVSAFGGGTTWGAAAFTWPELAVAARTKGDLP
ncbi:beta-ketoacyl-ACP synthase III [Micromonospora yangpuensis]|uniref:Beta-ketoacyl-[acyl-carrier-protein] synthase III n=1 Tax=Micromonospora yangpuensis TaxID=683228 RepID=A0A1C6UWK1_9ACTN|nr:beta-ketoacyl-ACP synthase III [Micromonospora yangpuensis]GGM25221.1 3-oxoacyl-[acyl-carrier-protein] synthase 3 protein 3 [Micromonospora yangpuensis]SCL58425.1 3-oxoacyl-[acyl-carrier-protein] synthase-3 [Micromonospora yangpuensis]